MSKLNELENNLGRIFPPSEVASYLKINSWIHQTRRIVELVDICNGNPKKHNYKNPTTVSINGTYIPPQDEYPLSSPSLKEESLESRIRIFNECAKSLNTADPLDAKVFQSIAQVII